MPTQQGQTDQVLKIKLTSFLLQARWLDDAVAANGEAGLEVTTAYVGDGAPIKITVKDTEGKSAATLEGKILSNTFRARFKPAQPPGKNLVFEADLTKHSLKKASGILRVTPPVEFTGLRFTDEDAGKTVTEIPTGKIAGCEAKVKGLVDGDPVVIAVAVRYHKEDKSGAVFCETEVVVDKGKISLLLNPQIKMALEKIHIQTDLDKEGGKYHQPEFFFTVSARGVTISSDKAPATQTMTLHFHERPGVAGSLEGKKVTIIAPDGKKEEKTIPKDGKIEVAKTKPGKYKIKGDMIKTLKPVDAQPTPPPSGTIPISDDVKKNLVKFITTFEGGAGDKAYSTMNLDWEFEGYWDLPKGWYKKGKDGSKIAKPTSFDPDISYSKFQSSPMHIGLSYGIIQFTQAGTLGDLIKEMHKLDSAKFKEIFGEFSDDLLKVTGKKGKIEAHQEEIFDNIGVSMGKKMVRRQPSVQPVGGHELWTPYWTEKFKTAGKWKPFQDLQDKFAITEYLNPCLKKIKERGYKTISDKSLTLIFDRWVNGGPKRGGRLAVELYNAKDEKEFWDKTIDKHKEAVGRRMRKIFNMEKVSWNLFYEIN